MTIKKIFTCLFSIYVLATPTPTPKRINGKRIKGEST